MNFGIGVARPTVALEVAASTADASLRIGSSVSGSGSGAASSAAQSIDFGKYEADGTFVPGASIKFTSSSSGTRRTQRGTLFNLTATDLDVRNLQVNGSTYISGSLSIGAPSHCFFVCLCRMLNALC